MESIMFPNFRAWLHAFRLAIPAYFGAAIAFSFEFWRFLGVGIVLARSAWEASAFFLVISLAAIVGGFLWFLLLAGLYSVLLKLFWSNPPAWLASPPFPRLALKHFPILLVATLPLSSISLTFTALSAFQDLPKDGYVDAYVSEQVTFVLRFSVLWLVSAAYLYQLWPSKSLNKH